MIKRIVIAGCRNYDDYDEASTFIDFCLFEIRKEHTIIIVSGGSTGADALGERYAIENGFEIEKHPADWKNLGRKHSLGTVSYRWFLRRLHHFLHILKRGTTHAA